MNRRVVLTRHAVNQAVARFPEVAGFMNKFPDLCIRALTACAGAAEVSAEEHYIADQGFLVGKLKTPFVPYLVPIYFAFRRDETDKYTICTVLDEANMAHVGGRRT